MNEYSNYLKRTISTLAIAVNITFNAFASEGISTLETISKNTAIEHRVLDQQNIANTGQFSVLSDALLLFLTDFLHPKDCLKLAATCAKLRNITGNAQNVITKWNQDVRLPRVTKLNPGEEFYFLAGLSNLQTFEPKLSAKIAALTDPYKIIAIAIHAHNFNICAMTSLKQKEIISILDTFTAGRIYELGSAIKTNAHNLYNPMRHQEYKHDFTKALVYLTPEQLNAFSGLLILEVDCLTQARLVRRVKDFEPPQIVEFVDAIKNTAGLLFNHCMKNDEKSAIIQSLLSFSSNSLKLLAMFACHLKKGMHSEQKIKIIKAISPLTENQISVFVKAIAVKAQTLFVDDEDDSTGYFQASIILALLSFPEHFNEIGNIPHDFFKYCFSDYQRERKLAEYFADS